MRATIIADASWCPDTKAAGYAFWIASDRGKQGGSGAFKERVVTSCVAEMMALVNGLHTACKQGLVQNADSVLMQTDCLGAIQAFQGQRGYMSPVEQSVVKYYEELLTASSVHVSFRHVKGHTTRKEPRYYINSKCDEFAKKAMRKARAQFLKETS